MTQEEGYAVFIAKSLIRVSVDQWNCIIIQTHIDSAKFV